MAGMSAEEYGLDKGKEKRNLLHGSFQLIH